MGTATFWIAVPDSKLAQKVVETAFSIFAYTA